MLCTDYIGVLNIVSSTSKKFIALAKLKLGLHHTQGLDKISALSKLSVRNAEYQDGLYALPTICVSFFLFISTFLHLS